METVWEFYGPWLRLMLVVGLPLLLLGTPVMFLSEGGSFTRWLTGRFALVGWTLVILSVGLYFIIRVVQDAFTNLPGM